MKNGSSQTMPLELAKGDAAGAGAPKRKMIIGGNWKCNGTIASMKTLVNDTLNKINYDNNNVEIVVAPISIHLSSAKTIVDSKIHVAC